MGRARYDVVLHGFPNGTPTGDTPVVALARAFQLPPAQAERFVQGLPKVVKHEADAALASRYEQVLRGIGADVEVRPSGASADVAPMRPDATFRPGVAPGPVAVDDAASPAGPAQPAPPVHATYTGRPAARTPGGAETPAPPPVRGEAGAREDRYTPGDAVFAVPSESGLGRSGLAWDEAMDADEGPAPFADGPVFDPDALDRPGPADVPQSPAPASLDDAPFALAAAGPRPLTPRPPVRDPLQDRVHDPLHDLAQDRAHGPIAGLSTNDPTQSSIGGSPMFTSPSGLELAPVQTRPPPGRRARLPRDVRAPAGPTRRATEPTSAIPDRVPRPGPPVEDPSPLELVEDRTSSRSDSFEPATVGTPISGVRAVDDAPLAWLDEASGRAAPDDRRPGATSPIPDSRFTGRSFASSIVVALFMPLSPGGLKWLGITSAGALFFGALSMFASFLFIFGLLLILVGAASLLTLNAFCFQAFMASAAEDGDEPLPFPDIVDWKAELAFPGFLIMMWFVAALVPLGVWTGALGGSADDPIGFVLALAPMLLWPMAATVACVDGSFTGLFQFPRILAGILRAPLRYLAVIAIGLASGIAVIFASRVLVGGGGISALLLGAFLMNAGFAWGNGVMGAMMGRLVAEVPDVLVDG